MGRTKQLIEDVFSQELESRLQYEEMIYEFNKKLYEDYFRGGMESSEG